MKLKKNKQCAYYLLGLFSIDFFCFSNVLYLNKEFSSFCCTHNSSSERKSESSWKNAGGI